MATVYPSRRTLASEKRDEKNSNQILYFDNDYTFEQTMENPYYVTNAQPMPHFFIKIEVATCGWLTCCVGMQRCKKEVGKK